jgi:hypothetical protein
MGARVSAPTPLNAAMNTNLLHIAASTPRAISAVTPRARENAFKRASARVLLEAPSSPNAM